MSTETLVAFVLASLVLAVTPGPGVLYVVARTLAQGRAAGLASVAGVALGNAINAAVAAIGLAALLAVSAGAYTLLKLAGAAYLLWLGWRTWRGDDEAATDRPAAAPGLRRACRDGVLVAALNPKTALFFAAFLPQFVDPARAGAATALGLGAAFVAIAACSDATYVLLAAGAAPRLRTPRAAALGRRVTALVYVALGLWAALSERPRG